MFERHFKNEDCIKDKITEAHRRGVCDSSGRSIKTSSGVTAKPVITPSCAKVYVYREGKMVLKNG